MIDLLGIDTDGRRQPTVLTQPQRRSLPGSVDDIDPFGHARSKPGDMSCALAHIRGRNALVEQCVDDRGFPRIDTTGDRNADGFIKAEAQGNEFRQDVIGQEIARPEISRQRCRLEIAIEPVGDRGGAGTHRHQVIRHSSSRPTTRGV